MDDVSAVVAAGASGGVPGAIPAHKRNGSKGMVPTTWMNRGVKVEYTDCGGQARYTSGTLLDYSGMGPILNIKGARTLIAWDRIGLLELATDK